MSFRMLAFGFLCLAVLGCADPTVRYVTKPDRPQPVRSKPVEKKPPTAEELHAIYLEARALLEIGKTMRANGVPACMPIMVGSRDRVAAYDAKVRALPGKVEGKYVSDLLLGAHFRNALTCGAANSDPSVAEISEKLDTFARENPEWAGP